MLSPFELNFTTEGLSESTTRVIKKKNYMLRSPLRAISKINVSFFLNNCLQNSIKIIFYRFILNVLHEPIGYLPAASY